MIRYRNTWWLLLKRNENPKTFESVTSKIAGITDFKAQNITIYYPFEIQKYKSLPEVWPN